MHSTTSAIRTAWRERRAPPWGPTEPYCWSSRSPTMPPPRTSARWRECTTRRRPPCARRSPCTRAGATAWVPRPASPRCPRAFRRAASGVSASSPRRPSIWSSRPGRRSEPISHATHRLQRGCVASQLATQRSDHRLDDVAGRGVGRVVPLRLQELVAGHRLARTLAQVAEYTELQRRQRHALAIDDRFAGGLVDRWVRNGLVGSGAHLLAAPPRQPSVDRAGAHVEDQRPDRLARESHGLLIP